MHKKTVNVRGIMDHPVYNISIAQILPGLCISVIALIILSSNI